MTDESKGISSKLKQQLYSSVYTSQGTMEQLLAEQTIQALIRSFEEKHKNRELQEKNMELQEKNMELQEKNMELQEKNMELQEKNTELQKKLHKKERELQNRSGSCGEVAAMEKRMHLQKRRPHVKEFGYKRGYMRWSGGYKRKFERSVIYKGSYMGKRKLLYSLAAQTQPPSLKPAGRESGTSLL